MRLLVIPLFVVFLECLPTTICLCQEKSDSTSQITPIISQNDYSRILVTVDSLQRVKGTRNVELSDSKANFQSQLDSLRSVISMQDKAISGKEESQKEIDSLKVRIKEKQSQAVHFKDQRTRLDSLSSIFKKNELSSVQQENLIDSLHDEMEKLKNKINSQSNEIAKLALDLTGKQNQINEINAIIDSVSNHDSVHFAGFLNKATQQITNDNYDGTLEENHFLVSGILNRGIYRDERMEKELAFNAYLNLAKLLSRTNQLLNSKYIKVEVERMISKLEEFQSDSKMMFSENILNIIQSKLTLLRRYCKANFKCHDMLELQEVGGNPDMKYIKSIRHKYKFLYDIFISNTGTLRPFQGNPLNYQPCKND